jgi:hypothetical protein
MTRSLQDHPNGVARRRCRNTAEPSGELSKGDVVVIGEVALAVASVGWTPVSGGLTEVRTSEHGTRPLPLPGSVPGSRPAPGEGGPR